MRRDTSKVLHCVNFGLLYFCALIVFAGCGGPRIETFPPKNYGGYKNIPFEGLNGTVKSCTKFLYTGRSGDYICIPGGKVDYIDKFVFKDEKKFYPDGVCYYWKETSKKGQRSVYELSEFDRQGRRTLKRNRNEYEETWSYDDIDRTVTYHNSEGRTVVENLPVFEKTRTGWKKTDFYSDGTVYEIELYDRQGRILKHVYYDEYGNIEDSYYYKIKESREGEFKKITTTAYGDNNEVNGSEEVWYDLEGTIVKKRESYGTDIETETSDRRFRKINDLEITETLDSHGEVVRDESILKREGGYHLIYKFLNYYDAFDNLVIQVRENEGIIDQVFLWEIEYYDSDYRYDHKKEHTELFVEHKSYSGDYYGYSTWDYPNSNGNNYDYQPLENSYSGGDYSSSGRSINCPSCANTGKCSYCGGSGYAKVGGLGLQSTDYSQPCSHCGGTGICPVCHGNHM